MNTNPIMIANIEVEPTTPPSCSAMRLSHRETFTNNRSSAFWWGSVFAIGALLGAFSPVAHSDERPVAATVNTIVGACEFRTSAAGEWGKLEAGQQLRPGDELHCETAGRLTFTFGMQGSVKLIDGDSPDHNSYVLPFIPVQAPEQRDHLGGRVSSAQPAGPMTTPTSLGHITTFMADMNVSRMRTQASLIQASAPARTASATATRARAQVVTCVVDPANANAVSCIEIDCGASLTKSTSICRLLDTGTTTERTAGEPAPMMNTKPSMR